MDPRPLQVLAASADRSLLRRLTLLLESVGYHVRQAADVALVQATVESSRPDIFLLDENLAFRGGLDVCRALAAQDSAPGLLTMLLTERLDPRNLRAAIEAGIDDVLAKPINRGEVLARVRAGARTLEFERRARAQAGLDRLTGLLSRSAFLAALGDWLTPSSGKPRRAACVVVDIDNLARVNERHGCPAGDELLRSVALHLVEHSTDKAILAGLGGGAFAALLANHHLTEAAEWAEKVRASLAETEFNLGDATVRLSASCGVAEHFDGHLTSEALLNLAEAALTQAKRSGRDCVVRAGEFDEENRKWADLLESDRLFEKTTARDVMTPCLLVVSATESVDHALSLVRRFGQSAIPVVDAQGKLAGLFHPDQDLSASRGNRRFSGLVRDVMTRTPAKVEESAALAELVDLFEEQPDSTLIVEHEGAPLGFVSRASLAALRTPVSTATFAPTGGYSGGSEYLIVPA